MLKILAARLHHCVNQELPDVQTGLRKAKGTRDQMANIHWIIEKAREFQKNIYFCVIDYAKAFDCVNQHKLENSKEMGIPDHLTCLLRNLYAGQEATVRTGHGTTDWLFNLCVFPLCFMCTESLVSKNRYQKGFSRIILLFL